MSPVVQRLFEIQQELEQWKFREVFYKQHDLDCISKALGQIKAAITSIKNIGVLEE